MNWIVPDVLRDSSCCIIVENTRRVAFGGFPESHAKLTKFHSGEKQVG
jgi:hypothetical protein